MAFAKQRGIGLVERCAPVQETGSPQNGWEILPVNDSPYAGLPGPGGLRLRASEEKGYNKSRTTTMDSRACAPVAR